MSALEQFHAVGSHIEDASKGNMFGYLNYKIGRKPFMFFDRASENAIAFKLGEPQRSAALNLAGASVFNPGDKNRPMRNWILVPFDHVARWEELALQSYEYVWREINKGGQG